MSMSTAKRFLALPVCARRLKQNNGYVLLISTIILGAITTTIGITLLTVGLSASQTSYTQSKSADAKALANACTERALEQVRGGTYSAPVADNTSFGAGKSCTYSVISPTSPPATIQATGAITSDGDTFKSRIKVEIDVLSPNLNVKSWREVSDFP